MSSRRCWFSGEYAGCSTWLSPLACLEALLNHLPCPTIHEHSHHTRIHIATAVALRGIQIVTAIVSSAFTVISAALSFIWSESRAFSPPTILDFIRSVRLGSSGFGLGSYYLRANLS